MESIETKTTDIRTIYKTEEFEEFYNDLNARVKDKFEYTFELVQTVYALPVKYIKHLDGTDLYEMRVSVGSNEYRTVLFAIDNSNVILATKIILLNGFLKKSTKDYNKQIAKADSEQPTSNLMRNMGNMVQILVRSSMRSRWHGIMVIYFVNAARS